MRLVHLTAVLAVTLGALAATSPEGPEVVDPCGDTRTGAAGSTYDHPVPAGTDLQQIDVVDRADGGVDVVFEVCGDRLAVATNDMVRLTWDLPALDGCSRSRATARVVNAATQDGLRGEYEVFCIVDSDECPPGFPAPSACSTTTVRSAGIVTVPVTADGARATVAVDRDALPSDLAASFAAGTTLANLRAFGSTLAGTNAEYAPTGDPGDAQLVSVSAVDKAEGRDHVLGEDR